MCPVFVHRTVQHTLDPFQDVSTCKEQTKHTDPRPECEDRPGPSHHQEFGDKTVQPRLGRRTSDLSALDGRSVAVILRQAGREFVIRGTAMFQRDDALGNILRITVPDDQHAETALIISEQDWQGRIIPDVTYGCDLCIIPGN